MCFGFYRIDLNTPNPTYDRIFLLHEIAYLLIGTVSELNGSSAGQDVVGRCGDSVDDDATPGQCFAVPSLGTAYDQDVLKRVIAWFQSMACSRQRE